MYVAILNLTDDHSIEHFVEKKLQRALARYTDRLSAANVKIENVAGGQNSILKRCQIEIQTAPRGTIRVQGEDESVHAAVARALRTAQMQLSRSTQRQIARSRNRYRTTKRSMIAETV